MNHSILNIQILSYFEPQFRPFIELKLALVAFSFELVPGCRTEMTCRILRIAPYYNSSNLLNGPAAVITDRSLPVVMVVFVLDLRTYGPVAWPATTDAKLGLRASGASDCLEYNVLEQHI